MDDDSAADHPSIDLKRLDQCWFFARYSLQARSRGRKGTYANGADASRAREVAEDTSRHGCSNDARSGFGSLIPDRS